MNAQVVIEVLDEVGGWVAPDELAYQLGRRGERVNEAVLAGLCRQGKVVIEPAGYRLIDQARRPPRPHPSERFSPPQKTAPDLILEAMEGSDRLWWTLDELVSATGYTQPTITKAARQLVERGAVARETRRRCGRAGRAPLILALPDRAAVAA